MESDGMENFFPEIEAYVSKRFFRCWDCGAIFIMLSYAKDWFECELCGMMYCIHNQKIYDADDFEEAFLNPNENSLDVSQKA